MIDNPQKTNLMHQREALAKANFSSWRSDAVFEFVEQAGLHHQGDHFERESAKKAILENGTIWKALTPHQTAYLIEQLEFDRDLVNKKVLSNTPEPLHKNSVMENFLKKNPDIKSTYEQVREYYKPSLMNRFICGYNLSISHPITNNSPRGCLINQPLPYWLHIERSPTKRLLSDRDSFSSKSTFSDKKRPLPSIDEKRSALTKRRSWRPSSRMKL